MFFNDPLEQFVIVINLCTLSLFHTNLRVFQLYHFILIFLTLYLFNKNKYKIQILKLLNFIKDIIFNTIHINTQIYFPYILILFLLLLFSNLTGMVPYSFTTTSIFAITFYLSLMFFIGSNLIGIKKHGFTFFSLFIPKGVPTLIIPFLVIIEVISYLSRVFSLAIRIFANMMSGHILLKILMGLIWTGLTSKSSVVFIASIVTIFITWTIVFAVMFLELVIAFLQAYVFIVLVATYSNDTINLH